MKVALISTVYNEEATITQWITALKAQTKHPDEFVIVDGGSTDRTIALLKEGFGTGDFPKPRILVQRCNIAEGRNLAIFNTSSEIIASTDAGSLPDVHWLEEIVAPFWKNPDVGAVGGRCICDTTNAFQKKIERYNAEAKGLVAGGYCSPSSRNIAVRREAWEAVGGYPEWLTLTAEDALYNFNLHYIRVRFYFQPSALVRWEGRPHLSAYLKMIQWYGYGAGEMGMGTRKHLQWLATTIIPPLILFSRNPVSHIPFRYLRNASGAYGWLCGGFFGKKPPQEWKKVKGGWLSPQVIAKIGTTAKD